MFVPRRTNISYTQERGGQTFLHLGGGTNIFASFFVGGGADYVDVDEEIDVSEASFPGARIFRGP